MAAYEGRRFRPKQEAETTGGQASPSPRGNGSHFAGDAPSAPRAPHHGAAHAGASGVPPVRGAGSHHAAPASSARATAHGSGSHAATPRAAAPHARAAAHGSAAPHARAAASHSHASASHAQAPHAATPRSHGSATPPTSRYARPARHDATEPATASPYARPAGSHTHGAAPRGHAAAPNARAEAPRSASPHAPSPYSRSAASRSAASRSRTAAGRGSRASRTSGAPRKRSGRDIVSKVLIGVGILLLLVAGGIFISAQIGYQKAGAAYDELSQYVTVDDSSGDGVPVVDWDALKQVSEDIVAWLYIPGTDISFPVVQGDTNDQYLRALPDGSWNESGSIMLDCDQQAPGMVGQQTTVYGHHMSNGSMFDPIEKALDQANFDKMTTVYYLTPETTYKLSPLYTARVPETYVEARQENFGDRASLAAYLEDLRGYAQAEASDVDERIASTDRVLALVTCSGLAPADHRAIMICTVTEEMPSVSADDVQADVGAEGANASSDELVNPDLQG